MDSSPTSPDTHSDIYHLRLKEPLKTFYDFIDGLPPKLRAKTAKESNGIQSPSAYDLHLHESLVLKQVHHCPELPAIMVKHFREFLDTLHDFPESASIQALIAAKAYLQRKNEVLDAEREVLFSFRQKIACPVSRYASYFLSTWLQHDNEKDDIITFRCDPDQAKAIPDQLWYLDSADDPGSQSNDEIAEESGQKALALVKHKSCAAASGDFFRRLESTAKQGARFAWVPCGGEECKATNQEENYPIQSPQTPDSDLGVIREIVNIGNERPRETQNEPQESVDNTDGDSSYLDLLDCKIACALQQIWAEGCKHDLTLLMLSTYKHSVFMVRDRKTQSLFISDTLKPRQESLNLLEVSLAMTYLGVMDLAARSGCKVKDLITPAPTLDSVSRGGKDRGESNSDNQHPNSNLLVASPEQPKYSSTMKNSRPLGQSDNEMSALFLYFRCGIYQSTHPAFLHRRQPQQHNPLDCARFAPPVRPLLRRVSQAASVQNVCSHPVDCEKYPSVFVYAVAGHGAGGDVWRAKLAFLDGSEHSIVVKIGKEEDLHHEELAYGRLKACNATRVPKFWGSFSPKGNCSTTYIVLEDVGSPFTSLHHPAQQWMSQSDLDEILKSLESIHNAGIVHRDLDERNILERQDPDGTRIFTIIDFHLARVEDGTWGESATHPRTRVQKAEVAALRSLLDPWVMKK